MQAQVPAVVAVLVTNDPGSTFDEALRSLVAQDYAGLSVLVLVAGESTEDVKDRVASVLPDAFVRFLGVNSGFGVAANEVIGMVDGADFYLFCHDDVALDASALHIMVEESYRSNAGVVTPKYLNWYDSTFLLHVGMSCDKTGAVVDRVHPGEFDHGQHESVRDVFIAPGGCTLIRSDLFAQIGGFDPDIVAMGEDLDLSWRAQIAGSRVVVAPDARVRHLEMLASGQRQLFSTLTTTDSSDASNGSDSHRNETGKIAQGSRLPTLQELQRRHELRTVLKCYSRSSLARVLPQVFLLAFGEILVALLSGNFDRASAIARSWQWNFARLGQIRVLRKSVREYRHLPDSEIRSGQLHGSARLSTYFSRLVHQGLDAAHAKEIFQSKDQSNLYSQSVGLFARPDLHSEIFSQGDFNDFDEGDIVGRSTLQGLSKAQGGWSSSRWLSSRSSRLLSWTIIALVLAIGSRTLLSSGLPVVGQFAPFASWLSTWHHFFSGWHSYGVGTTAPADPVFGLLGIFGTFFAGSMGIAQTVLVLGCIPFGAIGITRLVAPFASPRARLIAAISYLGLPIAFNALDQGRMDTLVAYALFPWIITRLARASGVSPFDQTRTRSGWQGGWIGQGLSLGLIEFIALSFAPASAPMILVVAIAIVIGLALSRRSEGMFGVVKVAGLSTLVSIFLGWPWVVGTLLAGKRALGVFGLAGAPSLSASWSQLLRFAVGPVGHSPLIWLLVVVGLLPLFIAKESRFVWASVLWIIALISWVFALASTRGWMDPFAPSVGVVLVPAGVAVAGCIGLGIAAFEVDLSSYRFGWRQITSTLGIGIAGIGLLPMLSLAIGGSWGLVSTGYSSPLGFVSSAKTDGQFRVLWLANPNALPLGGWSIENGLSYAVSDGGPLNSGDQWAPAGPGPAASLATALQLAQTQRTVHLGRLLAPAGVRYIVLLDALAPHGPGLQAAEALPTVVGLKSDLYSQDDLVPVEGTPGFSVFKNTASLPLQAQRQSNVLVPARGAPGLWPSRSSLVGWIPLSAVASTSSKASSHAQLVGAPKAELHGSSAVQSSRVTVFDSYAPSGSWKLVSNGRTLSSRVAFGWAGQFANVSPGPKRIVFQSFPLIPLAVFIELIGWALLAAALIGRRKWLYWWWKPLKTRFGAGSANRQDQQVIDPIAGSVESLKSVE